jgi:phosphoglycolate phosphatase
MPPGKPSNVQRQVLFDLDGTLMDPREGFVSCIRHALISLGCDPQSDSVIASRIGPPLPGTMAVLLGAGRIHQVEAAVALYRERYATIGIYENRVYEGIPAALEEIRSAGARLYLATSKPQVFAERILVHFDLRRFFNACHGSELDGTLADKDQLIAHILRRESLAAGSTIMVGDRSYDVLGALANGVRSVGALWGYGSQEELSGAGAVAFADQPADLAAVLAAIG